VKGTKIQISKNEGKESKNPDTGSKTGILKWKERKERDN
jgi:hypothetical protein